MSDFTPEILQEEAAPCHAVNCQKCELSKQRKRVVWAEGNREAPLLILLDNPGLREDNEGHPFVCGTRQTLQYGFKESGLGLDRAYITYLLKCRPIRSYDKPLARSACFSHLESQLAQKKPRLLFGLGNTVVQSFFPDWEADVKSFRGKWHAFQGIQTTFSYHPLAVRRRPVLMKYFMEDFRLVVQRLNELQEEEV